MCLFLGIVVVATLASGNSVSPQDLIFADGFEDGSACAWSNGPQPAWYEDLDGDGFGNRATETRTCSPPTGWVVVAGDCDDGNPGIFPGATATLVDGSDQATVTVMSSDCSFSLATTATLRYGLPANPRSYFPAAGGPRISTGNLMFDGLYALALTEMGENSVSAVHDSAYDNGMPIACPPGGCFESGRLWSFVQTRDTAYAVDLALGALDPTRARNSLEFKTSERRGGGDRQLVQDAGTGGSYPVSSDRATWAFGAWRLTAGRDGLAVRTSIHGKSEDGGPACATVSLLSGWTRVENIEQDAPADLPADGAELHRFRTRRKRL